MCAGKPYVPGKKWIDTFLTLSIPLPQLHHRAHIIPTTCKKTIAKFIKPPHFVGDRHQPYSGYGVQIQTRSLCGWVPRIEVSGISISAKLPRTL